MTVNANRAIRFRIVDSATAPGVLGFVRLSDSGAARLFEGRRGEDGAAMLRDGR